MQNVPKKKHAARRHSRIPPADFRRGAGRGGSVSADLRPHARPPRQKHPRMRMRKSPLWAVESADITRIRIAVRNQDAWSAVQTESGALVLEGEKFLHGGCGRCRNAPVRA